MSSRDRRLRLGRTMRWRQGARRDPAGPGGGALRPSLEAAGIDIRPPAPEEQALLFDRHLQQAQAMEREGNWTQAAAEYDHIRTRWANARWMDERAAGALSQTRRHDRRAADICRRLNREQPTVSTLLLEARLMHRAERPAEAIPLLEQAETILSGKV
jgi:hypothetical protein